MANQSSDWVRIPNAIVDSELRPGPKLLAALQFALPGKPEARELVDLLGCHRDTPRRWRAELRAAGFAVGPQARPTRRYFEVPRNVLINPALSVGARVIAIGRARRGQKSSDWVRIPNAILDSELPPGPKFLAALQFALPGKVGGQELADLAGCHQDNLRRWRRELRAAGFTVGPQARPTSWYFEVPRNVVTNPALCVAARVVAMAVGRCAQEGQTGVRQAALAALCGMKRRTVRRHLKTLRLAGILEVNEVNRARFKEKRGRGRPVNRYRFSSGAGRLEEEGLS